MAVLSRLTTTVNSPLLLPRSYHVVAAAAAQPQLDYDRYYNNNNNDEATSPHSASTAAETDKFRLFRGVHWVFIGNPNARKHVYAEMISKLLQVPYISITNLLRQDLNPHSPLYKQIAEAVNRKKIVPETIIFGLLSKRLEDARYNGESGFILDGIPRTRLQAEILDQLVDIDLVVNFKICSDNIQAAKSAADPSVSSDDAEPTISTFYREQRKLLEDYYRNQRKIIDFQVGNAPGETWEGLIAALHLQHVNAVHSTQRLTMGFRVP